MTEDATVPYIQEAIDPAAYQRLRDAAADALEWLAWLQFAGVLGIFCRRRSLPAAVIAMNEEVLGQAIAALKTALAEPEGP